MVFSGNRQGEPNLNLATVGRGVSSFATSSELAVGQDGGMVDQQRLWDDEAATRYDIPGTGMVLGPTVAGTGFALA